MAITPEVRLTYVSVDEPKANQSGVLKYSVGILIPKTNKDAIDWFKRQIDAAIEKGIQKGKFNKAGSQNPTFKYPLRDGDAYYEIATDDKKDSRAAYRGHMFVSASSNDNPESLTGMPSPSLKKARFIVAYGPWLIATSSRSTPADPSASDAD